VSRDEQREFDALREQLSHATRDAEQSRVSMSSALLESVAEAKLYRNLFWLLLAFSAMGTIVHLLQN
jgi:hypothetical protein